GLFLRGSCDPRGRARAPRRAFAPGHGSRRARGGGRGAGASVSASSLATIGAARKRRPVARALHLPRAAFAREQRALALHPPPISPQLPVLPHHAVARDYE